MYKTKEGIQREKRTGITIDSAWFPDRERKCDLGIVLWHLAKAREERVALATLISNRNRGVREQLCATAHRRGRQ